MANETQIRPQHSGRDVLLHRITNRIRQSLELQEILNTSAVEMRSFLQTDRVLIYRFHNDNSGEVIAESMHESGRLDSLLGLNFPADDIPPRARELYLKTRMRSVVDVNAGLIGLSHLDCPESGQPLADDDIHYRSVDPCHGTYLRSMGVSSSLVVPILHRDRLWGLLVSHHSQPRPISEDELQVVQLVADQVSIAIAQSMLLSQTRARAQREATVNRVGTLLHAQPTVQLQAALEASVAAFDGIGGRLYVDPGENAAGVLLTCGTQPLSLPDWNDTPLEIQPQWQQWIDRQLQRPGSKTNGAQGSLSVSVATDLYNNFHLDGFSAAFQPTPIRGSIVIPLDYRQQRLGYLTLFRPEIDTKTYWAGQFDPSQKQTIPRRSFESWCELRRGQAPEWTPEDIELARALGDQFAMAIQQYTLYQQVQSLNANLERQVEERTAQLQKSLDLMRVLQQVTHQIRSTLDSRQILQTIVREVRGLLQTDRVVIYQFQPNGLGEVTFENVGDGCASILGYRGPRECFPDDYADLYVQGRVRQINDAQREELTRCHREFLQHLQVRANLIVPIRMEKKLWGLLIAHECQAPRTWQPEEIDLLQQLADRAAIAIQQAQLYEQSQQSAATAQGKASELEGALQELKQAQAKLIQSEKMSGLGQLVAGVAHEINNPVNFIYGNLAHASDYASDLLEVLELYQQHYPTPPEEIVEAIEEIDLDFLVEDLPKMLASMKVGADRIRQIVLSLRHFSRFDRAQMKSIDLHEGIDSTLMILQNRLKAKGDRHAIEIVKKYGDLPAVECYGGQLNQVFMNLLSNAIDALEDRRQNSDFNTPKIQIQTEVADENFIQIRISDNGTGIPEEARSQLFDPFFTTKPPGKGTGLGLSIAYQIVVEKHQGSLECHSQIGEGTEFLIKLPSQASRAVKHP